MVVNHSVKLLFDFRLTRLCLKNCMLKKPITRQHKLRLSCNGASTVACIVSLCFLFPKRSSILFGSPNFSKMRLETALPTKKLYAYKSLSSRIFFGWKGKSARFKKTVAQNNPFIARRKTDLKRGFTPKKAYAYKSPVMARLSDGSGWFPPRLLSARQLRSIQLRGAISLCALPPARGVRHT